MGKIRITGMNSGLDTDSMVRELVNASEKQGEKYTKAKTKTEWKQEAWATLNNKIKTFFTKQAGNMRFSSAYSKKKTSVSDSTKASIVTGENAVNGSQTLKINKLAKSGYLTGAEITTDKDGHPLTNPVTKDTKLSDLGFDIPTSAKTKIKIGVGEAGTADYKTMEFEVDSDTTLSQFAKLVSSKEGLNASFDEANGRFFINSSESGVKNNFNFISEDVGADIEKALGLQETYVKNGEDYVLDENGNKIRAAGSAVKINGENAEIELNGATFTSATNNFSINGLTITAKAVSDEMSITTDTDYDAVYDNVKNFFKEYNSLMNEMDKLFNAASSKGYEPLTSEEKEAMTEDEIKQWEKKIKDSLLKNDSELDTVASTMRNAMLSTIEIDGTKYSLSSFGINTLGYFNAADNEKNAYHIDGDADDPDTSGNENRLKAMIASNPDVTATFFQELSKKLYNAMDKISRTSDNYTSFGNFYSDKKLQNDYVDKDKQVKKWEDYVAKQEEKYYKQFTAMESAMSSLNSQQSYISQLFAG